jgi:hypothetical protein
MVIQVFVSQSNCENPLRQHRTLLVHDVTRIARIRQAFVDRVDQSDCPIDLT